MLADDLRTPQGLVQGTAVPFGNAWKVETNCLDVSETMNDPCSYNTDRSERFFFFWLRRLTVYNIFCIYLLL